jgi:Ricin-type beta-trefoil lectin domain-like
MRNPDSWDLQNVFCRINLRLMKGGIVLSTALVALLLRSSPVIAADFFIIAMHSQKCAQVDGASQDDGATISQWQCLQQSNVLWHYQDGGPGFFFLQANHSRKCAIVLDDTPQFSQNNGAPISQWTCDLGNPLANFLWHQRPAGGGYFYIVNKASNKCMQVDGASNDDGATISQWDCVDQPNVKWKIPEINRL